MAYTVSYCDRFMDELLDKMGSDYFPLPIKLSRFESITLNFIRESSTFLEATQELSDDIVELSNSKTINIGARDQLYMGKKFYRIPYPSDYIRLLNVIPFPSSNGKYVLNNNYDVQIYKIGNFAKNENNPFRQATGKNINIYRIDGSVLIDTDQPVTHASFTYLKKPTFGKNPNDVMVNLSDLTVDKLMQKTCVSLRATTSDQDTAYMDEYVERQGQKIK